MENEDLKRYFFSNFQTEPNKDENGDGDSESESQNWETNPKGDDHYDDEENMPHEPEMDLDEVSLCVF